MRVHVAVGVICNESGQILIALRAAHQHQGNLWEFPGGKVEHDESCHDALSRELKEELGIDVLTTRPLIQIEHHYSDKSVLLDVHYVTEFRGNVYGREGQPVKWVAPQDLYAHDFPAANTPILHAVNLPELMVISDEVDSEQAFERGLRVAVGRGASILLLRLKSQPFIEWQKYLGLSKVLYPALPVVVNSAVGESFWSQMPGLHLTSEHLLAQVFRPVSPNVLLGASCHNASEVAQANCIGVDYITLSPVLPTATHPDAQPLGWDQFGELARLAQCPVYALGGLTSMDVGVAHTYGAQGVAAVSYFWT